MWNYVSFLLFPEDLAVFVLLFHITVKKLIRYQSLKKDKKKKEERVESSANI